MKTFRKYKTKRPFTRPDRYNPAKDPDMVLGLVLLAVSIATPFVVVFLIKFAGGA